MTKTVSTEGLSRFLGTIFLWSAGVLAVLIFVDKWTELQLPFPRFWYTTRSLHAAVCAGLVVLGWLSHRNAFKDSPGEDATSAVFQSVIVFSKPGCSLCDSAMEILSEYSDVLPEVKIVDITGDEELEELYSSFVPVIEIDGRIRFRGIVSAELLERMIDAKQRQDTA